MKLLVLTSEPISARQLRDALGDRAAEENPEVLVVAPALQESGLRFWATDADEAIERAQEVWRRSVGELSNEGVPARGDTGESDPLQAIQDALQTFPAERITIFRHPDEDLIYREDFDLDEVRERFGLPVEEARVSSD
ncbi:MAG TPA: hypothetical protein VGF70_16120 [Solirubrobacteraceae bacterium]|jgi:hypothetical protein